MLVLANHHRTTKWICTIMVISQVILFLSPIHTHTINLMVISTPYICPYIPREKNHAPYQCQHLGTAAVLPTPRALPHTQAWERCHGCCLFQSPHPCRRKVLENMACLGMRRLKDTAQHLDIWPLITYHLLSPTPKLLLNLQLQASRNSPALIFSRVFSNLKLHKQVSNSFRITYRWFKCLKFLDHEPKIDNYSQTNLPPDLLFWCKKIFQTSIHTEIHLITSSTYSHVEHIL
jgi:hypothetical protein